MGRITDGSTSIGDPMGILGVFLNPFASSSN